MKILMIALMMMLLNMTVVSAEGVYTGPGFGPAPTEGVYVGPGPTPPTTPTANEVCLGTFGCMPVHFQQSGLFTIAEVQLPNGYVVAGISGACMPGWDCPAITEDATRDLMARLDDLHRILRFTGAQ
jgi:hypothetical protein